MYYLITLSGTCWRADFVSEDPLTQMSLIDLQANCHVTSVLTGEGYRVTTPTATETMLPWKREDDYDSTHPVKQNEFPPWCTNKEYLAYSSPSATFLGKN